MKFSKRTGWTSHENDITSTQQQLKADGVDILDLTESNPTRCSFSALADLPLAGLSNPDGLTYRPDSRGNLIAREAVCRYYAERHVAISPEQVFLTSSTSEAYSFLFRLLADVDDHILFPCPSYPLFHFLGDLNDILLDFYSLKYDKGCWQIDFAHLTEHVGAHSRALALVNPNNPTGSYTSESEFAQLASICRDNKLSIIADEVFWDYRLAQDNKPPFSFAGRDEVLTFTMSGISKVLGLPQMKLSWIIISGPDDDVAQARRRLDIIADTYLSVNTPVQLALPAWLEKTQSVQNEISRRLRSNLDFLKSQMNGLPACELRLPEGGWYAVVRLPAQLSEEQWVLEFLRKDHVFVHPGYFFDFQEEPFVVISLLPPEEVFQPAVVRIANRISKASA